MRRSMLVLVSAAAFLIAVTPVAAIKWPTEPSTTQFGTRHDDEALAAAMNAVVGVVHRPTDDDAFLRYLGLHGATKWLAPIATADDDRATAVAQTDRRIFVAGTTDGALGRHTYGGQDVFVRAYTINGSLVWSRQFGSAGDDEATGIAAGELAGLSIVGGTDGDLAGAPLGGEDAFVLHLTRRGHLLWSTHLGTSDDDRATCIDPFHPDLICGSTTGSWPSGSNAGGVDAFVARLGQTDGSVAWTRQIGTAADDVAGGIGDDALWFDAFTVGGTTGGAFPGGSSQGGDDAFVAFFEDRSDPSLLKVRQFGTTGDDDVAGFWSSNGFMFVGGSTDGTMPGATNLGGVDGWVAMLDVPLYDDAWVGTVWTQQFGTAGDDDVRGLSGPLRASEVANWTYAVGATAGTFNGEASSGRSDAFWSFRSEPQDAFAQDVLVRGLDAADAYRDEHAGTFDGFSPVVATSSAPSYVWLDAPTDPHGPFELTIADASGTTVRLWTLSRSGTYLCIQEDAGVVSYGHDVAVDLNHCSGG